MLSTLPGRPALWLAILLVAVLLTLARRVRIVGELVSIALTLALAASLVMLVGQRADFDPRLTRVAEWIGLDDQQVSGGEVHIPMSADGHFWARVTLDGVERRMLVDSGATVTAISDRTATAAGLTVTQGLSPVVLRTANGAVLAGTARVRDLRLGPIAARNLAVVVSPAFGTMNVLGMNFLSKLKSWRVEDRTLILEPHHPIASG